MCSTLTYSIIPCDIKALGDVLVLCCVHSSQSLFVFMNFNQRICKAPTCFHANAEPHPPHKADSCRLLTLQNNLPIHSHYTTACLFISSHLDCLALK